IGFTPATCEGSYFLFVDAAPFLKPGERDEDFCRRLVVDGGVAAVPVVAKILGLFNSVIVDYMKGASIVPFYLPDPSSELLQYIVSAILVLLGFRFLLYPQAKERSPNNPFSTPSSSQQLENEGTSQHAEAAQEVPQPA
ncbi:MAG: hypothetical protein AAFY81_02685, partial [Pseudomonadota bacterium]